MKGGFFKKVFLLYSVVFVLSIFFSELYISGVIKNSYIKSLQHNLVTQARLMTDAVDFKQFHLDELASAMKMKTGARVTFINKKGLVLGDSDAESFEMKNHSDRPEIQQAMIEGAGHSIRFSNTIKEDMLYSAVAINGTDGLLGTIRLAVPLTEVNTSIVEMRVRIFGGVAIVFIIIGLVTFMQFKNVQRLVEDVSAFSSSIADGRFNERLMLRGAGEFEQIAENLNYMAVELEGLIGRDREKYEQLDIILKSVPDVLIIVDSDNRIMMMNKAAEDFLSARYSMGHPIKEVLRNPSFITLLNEARDAGSLKEAEFEPEETGGRYFHAKASPVDVDGRHRAGMVILLHDITEAKRVEQVRKDFVANVSHELKTPITAIKGFADTLAQGAIQDRETAARFIKIIQSNIERIIKLVEDLMTLSSIELGVMELDVKETNLYETVTKTLENFHLTARDRGIELKVDVEDRALTVLADRSRLIQILSNLVDNALKYTDKGSITVGVKSDENGKRLFVSDTGPGVPEKHLPRLGERFYRIDASRSRDLGGTGLGLAIVKHLVAAHGWKLKIESKTGSGTTVRIIF